MAERIWLGSEAQKHVQAYLEYRSIVGDRDGGKLLSDAEYQEYRQRAAERARNRVYVTWVNAETSLECRCVGPSSKCFCGHKFVDHCAEWAQSEDGSPQAQTHCEIAKCRCREFCYVPIRGSQDLRCRGCKHSYLKHCPRSRICKQAGCNCDEFSSSFGCACGSIFDAHFTLFENSEQRRGKGRRVDNLGDLSGDGPPSVIAANMGGLTTFSSMLDGVDRDFSSENRMRQEVSDFMMRPKKKLSEAEEMAIYAQKYEGTASKQCTSTFYRKPKRKIIGDPFGECIAHPCDPASMRPRRSITHVKSSQSNCDSIRKKLSLIKNKSSLSSSSATSSDDISNPMRRRSVKLASDTDESSSIDGFFSSERLPNPIPSSKMRLLRKKNARVRSGVKTSVVSSNHDDEIEKLNIQVINKKQAMQNCSKMREKQSLKLQLYSLEKKLKLARAKVIHESRKQSQEIRRFERGLN